MVTSFLFDLVTVVGQVPLTLTPVINKTVNHRSRTKSHGPLNMDTRIHKSSGDTRLGSRLSIFDWKITCIVKEKWKKRVNVVSSYRKIYQSGLMLGVCPIAQWEKRGNFQLGY